MNNNKEIIEEFFQSRCNNRNTKKTKKNKNKNNSTNKNITIITLHHHQKIQFLQQMSKNK
jgi:hypothetical protein